MAPYAQTYTALVGPLIATEFGSAPVGMVLTTECDTVSMIDTVLLPELVTYANGAASLSPAADTDSATTTTARARCSHRDRTDIAASFSEVRNGSMLTPVLARPQEACVADPREYPVHRHSPITPPCSHPPCSHPPLTPPCVSPATISFWIRIVSSSTGSVTMIAAAASGPHESCSNVSTL